MANDSHGRHVTVLMAEFQPLGTVKVAKDSHGRHVTVLIVEFQPQGTVKVAKDSHGRHVTVSIVEFQTIGHWRKKAEGRKRGEQNSFYKGTQQGVIHP